MDTTLENNTYPSKEIAIRFKHRIVAIQCCPNGNVIKAKLNSRLFPNLAPSKKL